MQLEEKYVEYITFHQIFQEVAKQHGKLICLYDKQYYSYEQISQKVDAVVCYLKNNFAEGTRIGLYFVQSMDYIVSLLAVMQAGCTAVPVSGLNCAPTERLKQYLNCEVKVVLTTQELQQNISKLSLNSIIIEEGSILNPLNIIPQQYNINVNYRYDPEDVLGILQSRLQSLGVNNVYSPELDWVIGNHDISLAKYLAHEQRLYLSSNNNKFNNRTLLIPYRVSSIHWVGILIDIININQTSTVDKVVIIDPAKVSLCRSIVNEEVRSCATIYGSLGTTIINWQQPKLLQRDFTSCGPLVIENLLLLAGLINWSNYVDYNYLSIISDIRKMHIDCYKQQRYFSNKQNNAVNISLEQLLVQSGKKLFDYDEKYAIAQVALIIQANQECYFDLLITRLLSIIIDPDKYSEAQAWVKFVLSNASLLPQEQEVDEKTYIKLFDLIRLFINKERIKHSAYILNTSGSTGIPKKIAIQHDGLPFCMRSAHDFLKITTKDRIAAFADVAFDAHIFDIMMALGKGACLYVVPSNIRTDTVKLGQFYSRHKITITVLTPSMLQTLDPKNFPDLRVLLSTGEILEAGIIESWKKFNNNILFINGYGPSEVTIATTMGICEANQPPHIGTPILGLEIFILEKEPQDPKAPIKVPLGEEGELYITGYGVSKLGYIDNPELTKERFVEIVHPDDSNKKIKCFRTRDLAKIDPASGLMIIVGRIDRQFKINGKLCCPEEIESHIKSSAPNITRVYVNIIGSTITAYMQLDHYFANQDTSVTQNLVNCLYEKIAKILPNYMLPSRWIFTDNIKLNNSGKIDVHDIVSLEHNSIVYFARNKIRALPSNSLQLQISNIFREILNLSPLTDIYVDDSFDKLGANSLQLEMLFTRIKQQFEVEMLSLQRQKILQEPTILIIEDQINLSKKIRHDDVNVVVLLNPLDQDVPDLRPAIFLVHSILGDAIQDYYKITPYLNEFRLFGISYPKLYIEEFFDVADITELANKYINYIKDIQAQGPYFIIGWSLGGIIALEIADNLENNEEIVNCVMLDSVLWGPSQSRYDHAKNLVELFNHIKVILKLKNISLTIEEIYANSASKQEQIAIFSLRCCYAVCKPDIMRQLKIILSMKDLLLALVDYLPDVKLINYNSMVVAQQSFNLYADNTSNILPRLHVKPFIVSGNHFEILNNSIIYSYLKKEYNLAQQLLMFSQNVINVFPKYLNVFDITNKFYNISKIIFDQSYLNSLIYINANYPCSCYKILLKILYLRFIDLKEEHARMCYNVLKNFFIQSPLSYLRDYILDPDESEVILYLDNCLYDILNILCNNLSIYRLVDYNLHSFSKVAFDVSIDKLSTEFSDEVVNKCDSFESVGSSCGPEENESTTFEYDYNYNTDSDLTNSDVEEDVAEITYAFQTFSIARDKPQRESLDNCTDKICNKVKFYQ